jgi:hypothetical protein
MQMPTFPPLCPYSCLERLVCNGVRTETDFHIFVRGEWVNIWGGGGCCCLLWPGPGGNVQKGQGKSLTKHVF